jgi:PST family polysaccharide transporter
VPLESKAAVGTPSCVQPIQAAGAAATAAAPSGVDMADLKRQSVRGGAVTMVTQGIRIAIQITSVMVLSRLLSPNDYGIMAMVIGVTGFAGLFRGLGLSSAAIQKKDLHQPLQSNLFWINVAMGTLLTVIVAVASPLVAWFYGKPELSAVTLALSFSFVLSSLGTQNGARLIREMRFARQAVAGITGAVIGLAVSITMAFHGFSYWSLVWGELASSLATTILLFALSPFRPGLPTRGTGIRDMLKFGANVTAFDFVNYFHRNLDNILIGRFWGPGPLGHYSRAYALLMLPINTIRGPITVVGFPALSRLQDRPAAFREYYRKMTAFVALVSMPFTAFLFIASKVIIALALGPKWEAITPVFAILATVGFVQPVITLWGVVVLSRGMGRRYLHLGIFNTVCSAIGFAAGLPWGPIGVAVGYAVVTYLSAYPILIWAFRGTPLKFGDFTAVTVRPFTASIVAAILCFYISSVISTIPPFVWLALLGSAFMASYLCTLLLLPGGKSDFAFIGNLIRPVVASSRFSSLLKI